MSIYQHFRKEEHPFIDQVLSWKEDVERTFVYQLTDFLDPREQQIVQTIVGEKNEELKVVAFGGGEQTERKRMIIAPFYEEITNDMFQITLMQANYQEKFITISHRDVMGAFLSLGLVRDKLGDIFVKDGVLQIICDQELSTYVKMNLTMIKHAKISLVDKPFCELIDRQEKWLEMEKTVSSLRLDVVLKEIYQVSRKEASNLIQRKLAKVNFKVVDDPSFVIMEGDLLSIRGKGRAKLINVNGYTRKNKLRINAARLK